MSVQSIKSNAPRPVVFAQYRDLLARYLRPQRGRVALMSALLLTGITLQLVNPQVIRYFLDTAQAGGSRDRLLLAAAAFLLFALLQQGLRVAAGYVSSIVSWAATNRLRADLALHCLRLDLSFHKRHTPGEMIQRIHGDVGTLTNFFSSMVVEVLGNGLLVAGILILLFFENLLVGLGISMYTLLVVFVLGRIQRIAVPYWAADRQATAELYGYLEERISGVEELRAAGAEQYAIHRLLRLLRNLLHRARAAFVVRSLAYNLTSLIHVIGYAIGLAFGAALFMRGEATIGAAFLIVNYVGMLFDPLQKIREQMDDLQRASASIGRVQELLDLPAEASQAAPAGGTGTRLPDGALPVSVENLNFRYDANEDVLKEVCFEQPAGTVLGVLGRTGSGKSTLTRLLFRLYDPTAGAIRLGYTDLRDVPLAELRSRVGLVTQDVQLFQASVRDNLTFFNRRISDERLEAVLRDLRLWDWIAALPKGLDTVLGSGGQGLSAGEAQLLAFARVFLKDPGLVILDEASSRLDPATEARMERAIDRLFEERTGIVIAHRLKTVLRADEILILEGGRVVEYGPRAALAADPGSRFAGLLRTGLEEALA